MTLESAMGIFEQFPGSPNEVACRAHQRRLIDSPAANVDRTRIIELDDDVRRFNRKAAMTTPDAVRLGHNYSCSRSRRRLSSRLSQTLCRRFRV
jgi:hypothetical protein